MNSRNLCVIFLGGIFLSIPSELFSLPMMQLNSSLERNLTVAHQSLDGNISAINQSLEANMTAVNQSSTSVWKLIPVQVQKRVQANKKHTVPYNTRLSTRSVSTRMPTKVAIARPKEGKPNFVDITRKVPIERRVKFPEFKDNYLETKAGFSVASNPEKLFQPNTELSTVCMGSPIPHLEHKVMGWLYRHNYKNEHRSRRIYFTLRREIFDYGISEMCHDLKKYGKWMAYHECALRRNQRLEAYIPKYPLHQAVKD